MIRTVENILNDIAEKFDALKEDLDDHKMQLGTKTLATGRTKNGHQYSHSSKSISIFKLKESRGSLTASISLRSLAFLASEDPYDEEEATDEANLMEVSDKTHSFLSSACTRSLSNKQRKCIRGSILTTEDSSNQIPHY